MSDGYAGKPVRQDPWATQQPPEGLRDTDEARVVSLSLDVCLTPLDGAPVPVAHHAWFDGRAVTARLGLDGVHLDLRAAEGPWRVDLTWRGWAVQCPSYHGASLEAVTLAQAAGLPVSGEHGLAEDALA